MQTQTQNSKTIVHNIIKTKCFKVGDFTLTSGKQSKYYFDLKNLILDSYGLYHISKLISYNLMNAEEDKFNAIGGMELGAVPIITSVGVNYYNIYGNNLKMFIIRKQKKEHGTQKLVEGSLSKDDNVVLVDDVLTTGKSLLASINVLDKLGVNIVKIIPVLDRCEGGNDFLRNIGMKVEPLFTLDDFIK